PCTYTIHLPTRRSSDLYGYFYVAILAYFVRQSMQMGQFGMQGQPSMNVNQQLIRPLLQNVTILVLFVMPMVTMRTYSEEKRSGRSEEHTSELQSPDHLV